MNEMDTIKLNITLKRIILGLLGIFGVFLILFTLNSNLLTGELSLSELRSPKEMSTVAGNAVTFSQLEPSAHSHVTYTQLNGVTYKEFFTGVSPEPTNPSTDKGDSHE